MTGFLTGRGSRRVALCALLGVGGLLAAVSLGRAAADATGAVKIDNFHFGPTPLVVTAGTTVTWTNDDDIPHSIVIPKLQVRSHPMDTEGTFAYRFDKAGTYDYICGLHPFMKGQVTVKP